MSLVLYVGGVVNKDLEHFVLQLMFNLLAHVILRGERREERDHREGADIVVATNGQILRPGAVDGAHFHD